MEFVLFLHVGICSTKNVKLEFVLLKNLSGSWNLFYPNLLDGMCSINKKAVGKCSIGKLAVGICSTTVFYVRKCSTNHFFALEQRIPSVEICSISNLELESVLPTIYLL